MREEPHIETIFTLMSDGKPYTLDQIAVATGIDTPTVSARIRDLRKERYGKHTVVRRHLGDRVYSYQIVAFGRTDW